MALDDELPAPEEEPAAPSHEEEPAAPSQEDCFLSGVDTPCCLSGEACCVQYSCTGGLGLVGWLEVGW